MVLICTMPVQALAKTEIEVTDNGWDSQKLHNEIARIIVENAYDGYVKKLRQHPHDELAGDNRRRRGP